MDNIKKIKYIYFDLDGTLLDSNKVLRESLIDRILYVKKKYNIKIGIATGRHYLMTRYITNKLDPELPTITNNGSSVAYDMDNHDNLSPISHLETARLLTFMHEIQCDFLVYTSKRIYTNNQNNWRIIDLIAAGNKQKLGPLMWKYYDFNWGMIKNETVLKVMACTPDKNHLVENYVKQHMPNLSAVSSEKDLVDIFMNNADKYHCIIKVAKKLKIDVNHLLFFGDNNNDYLALKELPNTVYVGKSLPKLIKVSTYQTLGSDSNGVANFLIEYFP